MIPRFECVTDLVAQAEVVWRRRYGVVEMVSGRFRRLWLRPFPKLSTPFDFFLRGESYHRGRPGDRCLLYYNQPRACPNFLALKYVVSQRGTTLATFHGALTVLDEIARIKRTDAIVCDAMNGRISDRLLARWGWQPHRPHRWHRNYIKRFYGQYPAPVHLTAGAAASNGKRIEACPV